MAIGARRACLLPRRPMPDLLDESQNLAIQRVFDGDDHRPILPTINFSEIKGLRAGYLHQISGIQPYFGWNGREIDLQQLTIQTAKHRRVGIAIRQESDRNMLILLVRHVCYSVSLTANLKELSVCLMLGGSDFPAPLMRILFLSPRQSLPARSGAKLREYHFLRALGRSADRANALLQLGQTFPVTGRRGRADFTHARPHLRSQSSQSLPA